MAVYPKYLKLDLSCHRHGSEGFQSISHTGFFATLRKRLDENLAVFNDDAGKEYRISMSIGAIEFDPRAPGSLEELLGRADELLYAEKKKKKEAKSGP